MRTLTRAELSASVQSTPGFAIAKEAHEFLECFFDEIAFALERGEEVSLPGFGKFKVLAKHARPARNPRTLEPCTVCARWVVTFQPDPKLNKKCQPTDSGKSPPGTRPLLPGLSQ